MSNTRKPLVSVLIPAYNHELYVKDAILSVINQTYGFNNIQLIVADDFSTDNTASVIGGLADKYNFRVINHTKNLGACATLNEMISISEGEYVVSFASDDILVTDRIDKQVNVLQSNLDIDILAGNSILINEEGKIIGGETDHYNRSLINYNFDDIFLKLKPGFTAGTAIIRRNLFDKIGGYDPEYKVEDFYFWLKATYNNARIVKCDLPFIYYRIHQASLSKNEEMMIREGAKVLEIYKTHPKYTIALQNREFYLMSKWIFIRKIKVIKHLLKNPKLLLNLKIVRILIMLILPKFILKRKFAENYYRHTTH